VLQVREREKEVRPLDPFELAIRSKFKRETVVLVDPAKFKEGAKPRPGGASITLAVEDVKVAGAGVLTSPRGFRRCA
jgi:hypothetical protein